MAHNKDFRGRRITLLKLQVSRGKLTGCSHMKGQRIAATGAVPSSTHPQRQQLFPPSKTGPVACNVCLKRSELFEKTPPGIYGHVQKLTLRNRYRCYCIVYIDTETGDNLATNSRPRHIIVYDCCILLQSSQRGVWMAKKCPCVMPQSINTAIA